MRSRQRVGVTGNVNDAREQMSCQVVCGAFAGAPKESVDRLVFAGVEPDTYETPGLVSGAFAARSVVRFVT